MFLHIWPSAYCQIFAINDCAAKKKWRKGQFLGKMGMVDMQACRLQPLPKYTAVLLSICLLNSFNIFFRISHGRKKNQMEFSIETFFFFFNTPPNEMYTS